MGPKPRSYAQRTPKKMIKLALWSALSDRAAEGRVIVVDEWAFTSPSTKAARAALDALGVEGRSLVLLDRSDDIAQRSFRNLPDVHVTSIGELSVYDVLVSDYVVFTKAVVPSSAPRVTEEA